MKIQNLYFPLFLLVILLAGCKSSKMGMSREIEPAKCLSSRIRVTVPNKDGSITLSGTMKMKSGERVLLSVLMPILRNEVVRIDITPEEALLIDRMNKRYVRVTRAELKSYFPKEADFSKLEKLILEAAGPGGKAEFSGRELGIPSLEKARIRLYDFSTDELELAPTEISSRYTEVKLEELIKMFQKLNS